MEIKELAEGIQKAFTEYKTTNDERIKKLEKGQSVVDIEAKLVKISESMDSYKDRMDEMEMKANRTGMGGATEGKSEHEKAFMGFIRKGVEDGLADLQKKALNIGTDADGGYAVPEQLDRSILDLMRDDNPMRRIANVITMGGAEYKKLVNLHGTASGWVGETDYRQVTDSPTLASITPFMGELYAMPQATQNMLDDVFFNAEQWLKTELSEAFAEKEGAAFLTGTGTKMPKGFLAYTSAETADASRTFGQLEHMTTADATAITADELLELTYKLKKGMRSGAKWLFNKATLATVRKLKDGDGQYLWTPGLAAGQSNTLLGYSVEECEDMAGIAAGEVPVAFGDFKRGYTIVDRIGIRMLRDPYTTKPYVSFYTTKRVGGMVVDSNAIKLLKMKSA